MFNKILIVNRGEIALRIIRACKEMNIKSCTIHSKGEKNSPHVYLADESYCIDSNNPIESYLNFENILKLAQLNKIDAIHPGYGFLSENSRFISAISKTDIKFIGPDADTVELMGDKIKARKFVSSIGVPVVPGSSEPCKSIEEVIKIAEEIDYPLMLKASAGGGGKGMRIVQRENEIERAFSQASEEAKKAFGDGSMYVEKLLLSPRHIEVQLLCDHHGKRLHLFERECSIQRRHQKVIEEAPANIDDSLKKRMYTAALQIAEKSNYKNAGTVEFLVEGNEFYFLEMNTRLQVEHPVTEFITGVDIVKEQIRIADNQSISFNQHDLIIKGHSIECRVNSEDPFNNFFPSTGKVNYYRNPSGNKIRIDSGITMDSEISFDFDPMISKLICHENSRKDAIQSAIRALKEYIIGGVLTNIPYLIEILKSEEFVNHSYDINFLRDYSDKIMKSFSETSHSHELISSAVAAKIKSKTESLNVIKLETSEWGKCE
jgi:acetyl-CoA carboxylase biotin carboxylase subunit